ncbi:hypothetical protein GOBAR_AA10367 [Gossypium barbadense]|uniref:Uncharacterized protein n=1 Tax=Gossypium barbadense TaxID=3634 RepID=A0A2P5Y3T1_GOSBA|nr:hypothetical protein GOBAR_AA10367 [Gossypium barbadense]
MADLLFLVYSADTDWQVICVPPIVSVCCVGAGLMDCRCVWEKSPYAPVSALRQLSELSGVLGSIVEALSYGITEKLYGCDCNRSF